MKDPAILLYINDWLVSTADMDADCRGWFLNLLLHNYDKGELPNDIEKLAVLCNVRFSEFERFKQVFEQVLKHKFDKNDNGMLTNERTSNILRSRESFKEKRSDAGKMSYLMRFFSKTFPKEFKQKKLKDFIQLNFDFDSTDLKNKNMLEQVFKQMFELYRNENENENININKDLIENNGGAGGKIIFPFETQNFIEQWQQWKNYKSKEHGFKFKSIQSEQAQLTSLNNLSNQNEEIAIAIIHQSMANGWKGFFELKNNHHGKTTSNEPKQQYSSDFLSRHLANLQS